MTIGSTYTKQFTADKASLASAMGSGTLDVFATPALVAALENTCMESIAADLQEGTTTVGTRIDVEHLAASTPGAIIRCECTLVEQEGRRYTFGVKAYDGEELIGRGIHERVAVLSERFLAKLEARSKN